MVVADRASCYGAVGDLRPRGPIFPAMKQQACSTPGSFPISHRKLRQKACRRSEVPSASLRFVGLWAEAVAPLRERNNRGARAGQTYFRTKHPQHGIPLLKATYCGRGDASPSLRCRYLSSRVAVKASNDLQHYPLRKQSGQHLI